MSVISCFAAARSSVLISLIVFSIVFILTGFIMFSMMLLHKACSRTEEPKAAEAEKICAADDGDSELAAVIAAAVMQFVSENARVVSFRPSPVAAPKKTMWGRLARMQNFEKAMKR